MFEQNDTTDDSTYDFLGNDAEEESQEQTEQGWSWDFGDHSSASKSNGNYLTEAIRNTKDALDEKIDNDLMSVLEDAEDLVESTTVNKFECSHEDCGLGHSHPDWKHDIRASNNVAEIRSMIPGFNITDEFAEQMEFVPYCHCGANEAAMLVQFFPYINQPMFKDEEDFAGVKEIDPELLEEIYRKYHEGDLSLSRAVAQVSVNYGINESEAVPLGLRNDLEQFFDRREQIEGQAQKAPIGQETRGVIEANREELEELTS